MSTQKPREAAYKETTDLAVASYCHMRGLKIVKAQEWKDGHKVQYRFTFDDPPSEEHHNGRWDILLFDFANSEAMAFDNSVRTLKKLCSRSRVRK